MKFLNYVFMPLKIVFTLANSEDPDEMLPYAAFHLSLHCLQKYLFTKLKWFKILVKTKNAQVDLSTGV